MNRDQFIRKLTSKKFTPIPINHRPLFREFNYGSPKVALYVVVMQNECKIKTVFAFKIKPFSDDIVSVSETYSFQNFDDAFEFIKNLKTFAKNYYIEKKAELELPYIEQYIKDNPRSNIINICLKYSDPRNREEVWRLYIENVINMMDIKKFVSFVSKQPITIEFAKHVAKYADDSHATMLIGMMDFYLKDFVDRFGLDAYMLKLAYSPLAKIHSAIKNRYVSLPENLRHSHEGDFFQLYERDEYKTPPMEGIIDTFKAEFKRASLRKQPVM